MYLITYLNAYDEIDTVRQEDYDDAIRCKHLIEGVGLKVLDFRKISGTIKETVKNIRRKN